MTNISRWYFVYVYLCWILAQYQIIFPLVRPLKYIAKTPSREILFSVFSIHFTFQIMKCTLVTLSNPSQWKEWKFYCDLIFIVSFLRQDYHPRQIGGLSEKLFVYWCKRRERFRSLIIHFIKVSDKKIYLNSWPGLLTLIHPGYFPNENTQGVGTIRPPPHFFSQIAWRHSINICYLVFRMKN